MKYGIKAIALLSVWCTLAAISGCNKTDDETAVKACISHYGEQIAVEPINFIATCSKNANTFRWDFGDGTTAEGADVEHAFAQAGTYAVTVIASNPQTSNRITETIVVDEHPLSRFAGVYTDLGTGTCSVGNTQAYPHNYTVRVGPKSSGSDWANHYGYHLDFYSTTNGNLVSRVQVREEDFDKNPVPFSHLLLSYPFEGEFGGDTMYWDLDDCRGVSVRQ